MAINVELSRREFFNTVSNGGNFTQNTNNFTGNLVGNVMERIKAKLRVEVSWLSTATAFAAWTIEADLDLDNYVIRREEGSFNEDGWAIGNEWDLLSGNSVIAEGTVLFISDDGRSMRVLSTTDITGNYESHTLRANATKAANKITNIRYFPNILPNNDSFTDVFFTGEVSHYLGSSVGANNVARPIGDFKSFDTGEVKFSNLGNRGNYIQVFEIEHEFILTPYYLESDNLDLPSRYVFRFEGFVLLSDPNSAKTGEVSAQAGAVGDFGQTYANENQTLWGVEDFAYQDEPAGIAVELPTKLTFKVPLPAQYNQADIRYDFLYSLRPREVDYRANPFFTVWGFDNASGGIGGTTTGNDIIDTVTTTFVGGNIEFEVDFNAAFDNEINSEYMLALCIGSSTDSAANTERTVILLDVRNFISLAEPNDLILVNEFDIRDYHGSTNPSDLYPEDGFYADVKFQLDLNKKAFMESLSYRLVAINPTTNETIFLSESVNITLPNLVINQIQILDTEIPRGYLMQQDSIFNLVTLTTGAEVDGFVEYELKAPEKINWLERLNNPTVPESFFDPTKPQDNLNFLSSQYSNIQDFEVKFEITAFVRGEDGVDSFPRPPRITLQSYRFFSENINVFKYFEDGNTPPKVEPIIETYSLDFTENYGGNILTDRDTVFRVTWILEDKTAVTLGSTVTHRIEESSQIGTTIYELTNSIPEIDVAGNLLKPFQGETGVRLYANNNGDVVSECLISSQNINAGVAYNLSCKLTKI